jgi:predicted DNA-binding protein
MNRPKAVFTLDKNVINELDAVSKELKEKKSHIVEKALTYYFDTLDIQIADKRMKDLKSGKSKLVSSDKGFEELEI